MEMIKETKFKIIILVFFSIHEKTIARTSGIIRIGI